MACLVLTGFLFVATGCKQSNFSGEGGKKEVGKKESGNTQSASESFSVSLGGTGKVDIAFLLDTSSSMKEETTSLINGLQGFMSRLAASNQQLDYQIFIIGQSSKISLSLPDMSKIDMRNSEVNSHSALWNAYHFLEGNTDKVPAGRLNLRADAVKELVVLSDDDAKVITASEFGPYLKNNASKLGAVHVNGFVGLPTSVKTSSCRIAAVGQSYLTLASDPVVGGMIADLCTADWQALLGTLADQVKDRAIQGNVVTLKAKPTSRAAFRVTVDGVSFTDFTYDASSARLTLNPAKLSAGSHKVDVIYL